MSLDVTLENDLEEIHRLDSLRKQARDMMKKGLEGLRDKDRDASGVYKPGRTGWSDPGDAIDKSIVVNTWSEFLAADKSDEFRKRQKEEQKYLAELALPHLFHAKSSLGSTRKDNEPANTKAIDDHVPILRSAQALHTLALIPGLALCDGAINSYFRIAYELNFTSNPHEDLLGGASAGARGVPQTAFMTWWCVRSVLAFADAFDATAELMDGVKEVVQPQPSNSPAPWWEGHQKTVQYSATINLRVWEKHALIPIDAAAIGETSLLTSKGVKAIVTTLKTTCTRRAKAIEKLPDLDRLRNSLRVRRGEPIKKANDPKDPVKNDEVDKIITDFAYGKAMERVGELKAALKKISEACDNGVDKMGELVKTLRDAAGSIRETLHPAKQFLRNTLDHELAAEIAQPQRIPDGAEMLFAADALAQLSGKKTDEAGGSAPADDPGLMSALNTVVPLVTNQGRVPSHRPFDVMEKGYVLHVAGAEVIRVLSDLVRRLKFPVAAVVANKLLRHFSDTWRGDVSGWRHERDGGEGKAQWTFCGLSVLALDSVVRMLDARIDQMVLRHFSVRMPQMMPLGLDDLFYPDYGLVAAGRRTQSVAVRFQRMRAHLCKVEPPLKLGALHSAILHGPPGTGKTTLVEALAKSANVPLVEVTPSDIVLAGVEKIEGRARAVFEGLSLLSNVVILFDEFDSILMRRGSQGKADSHGSILQFVTPGMLPKLKNLNQNAGEQSVAFALSTNLIGDLDDAAVREGRFDEKIGLYPPDALSRVGQLRKVLAAMEKSAAPADTAERVEHVVIKSAGCPMERLGKPSWFTAPRKELRPDTPLSYISNGDGKDTIHWPGPEKRIPRYPGEDYGLKKPAYLGRRTNDPEEKHGQDKDKAGREAGTDGGGKEENPTDNGRSLNDTAYLEWMEWKFVNCLDQCVENVGVDAMIRRIKSWRKLVERGFTIKMKTDESLATPHCSSGKNTARRSPNLPVLGPRNPPIHRRNHDQLTTYARRAYHQFSHGSPRRFADPGRTAAGRR